MQPALADTSLEPHKADASAKGAVLNSCAFLSVLFISWQVSSQYVTSPHLSNLFHE